MGDETREVHETLEPEGEAKEALSPWGKGAVQSGRYVQAVSDTGLEELPEVNGFDDSVVMNDVGVEKFLGDEFPPEHTSTEHLKQIEYTDKYVPGEKPNTYVAGECTTYNGTSYIDINRQLPDGNRDGDAMKGTISHEVGHNVYWNVLSDEERGAWDKLSANSESTEYVSDYARTSVMEDFAETYRVYMFDPEGLEEVSAEKYAFMRDYVFGGREY